MHATIIGAGSTFYAFNISSYTIYVTKACNPTNHYGECSFEFGLIISCGLSEHVKMLPPTGFKST